MNVTNPLLIHRMGDCGAQIGVEFSEKNISENIFRDSFQIP